MKRDAAVCLGAIRLKMRHFFGKLGVEARDVLSVFRSSLFRATKQISIWCLTVEARALIFWCREGRGFSPAAKITRDLGALAPEVKWLQGLKAHSTLRPVAAGLNRLRKSFLAL